MEVDKGKVCVTGGTGFIGSWLIMRLLEHGYSVNTTIRPDPERKRDISFLTNLPAASKKLQIFEADLNEPESFENSIKGCIGVFHVATPIDFENKEPEEVVSQRAIEGTIGILKACLNCKTVRRVVYTSSMSAVGFHGGKAVETTDEIFWSDIDYVKSIKSNFAPYVLSKTSTEKKALQFAQQHGLDLVTVIPSFVNGPFICPKFPSSLLITLATIGVKHDSLNNISMVHVDDVARAHIFLFENPEAKGRYICSSHTKTNEEMFKFISVKYPELSLPTIKFFENNTESFICPKLSSKKLVDSGFEFKYGLDEMFDEGIQCSKKKSYL